MKIRYLISIMLQSLFNKKLVVVILLAMSTISIYMIDVITTDYTSQKYYIKSMTSMFGEDPSKVNYVEYLNLMNPEYTVDRGKELIDFIRNHENVISCGRFCNSNAESILNGESVQALVVEKDIVGIGNLGISQQDIDISDQLSAVYIGYNYRNDFKIGDEFNFYRDDDSCKCIVAGYLKKDASWPLKGNLFSVVSNLDSYTLENKIVVVTQQYEAFDNLGGMPDTPYFIVNNDDELAQIQTDIIKKSAENKLGVRVVNEEKTILQKTQDTRITQNQSFIATILLFLLALVSMSASSIVFCMLRRQQHGIMIVCGISKNELIAMNFLENIIITVVPIIIVWLIRQRELFGSVFYQVVDKNVDMLMYPYWYAHCISLPVVFLVVIVIVAFVSGIVPAILINNMSISEIIKPND